MGMGITAQTLARVSEADPDKHEVLKKLWEICFHVIVIFFLKVKS